MSEVTVIRYHWVILSPGFSEYAMQGASRRRRSAPFNAMGNIGICGLPVHVLLLFTYWDIHLQCFPSQPRNASKKNISPLRNSSVLDQTGVPRKFLRLTPKSPRAT